MLHAPLLWYRVRVLRVHVNRRLRPKRPRRTVRPAVTLAGPKSPDSSPESTFLVWLFYLLENSRPPSTTRFLGRLAVFWRIQAARKDSPSRCPWRPAGKYDTGVGPSHPWCGRRTWSPRTGTEGPPTAPDRQSAVQRKNEVKLKPVRLSRCHRFILDKSQYNAITFIAKCQRYRTRSVSGCQVHSITHSRQS